jgi:hypothetical protein
MIDWTTVRGVETVTALAHATATANDTALTAATVPRHATATEKLISLARTTAPAHVAATVWTTVRGVEIATVAEHPTVTV